MTMDGAARPEPPAPPVIPEAVQPAQGPPVAWEPPDNALAWEPPDPGPIPDGTWQSPGYASSQTRASALRAVLGLGVALDTAILLAYGAGVLVISHAITMPQRQVTILATLVDTLPWASVVLGIVGTVATLAWLSRLVDNLPPLTGRTPEPSPREAVGWWFVPVASWWMPYTIVRDAAWRLRCSDDDTPTALVFPWWVLRTSAAIVGLVAGRLLGVDDAIALFGTMMAVAFADICSAVLLIVIVTRLDGRERRFAAALGFSAAGGRQWPAQGVGWNVTPDELDPTEAEAPQGAEPGGGLGSPEVEFDPSADPLARRPGERLVDYETRVLALGDAGDTR